MQKIQILSQEQMNAFLRRYDALKSEIENITHKKDAEDIFLSGEMPALVRKQKSIEDLLLGNYGRQIVHCYGNISDFNAEYSKSIFGRFMPNAFAEFEEDNLGVVTLTKSNDNKIGVIRRSSSERDPIRTNETYLILGVVGIANTTKTGNATYVGTPVRRRVH